MSLPVTTQHTWTREELEALTRRDIVQTAKVCLLPPFLIFHMPHGICHRIEHRLLWLILSLLSTALRGQGAFRAQGQCENRRARKRNPGIVCLQLHLLSFRRLLDSSRQQSKLADAVPPEPSPESSPEASPELLPEPSPELSPELPPEPPQESRPSHHTLSVYEDGCEIA